MLVSPDYSTDAKSQATPDYLRSAAGTSQSTFVVKVMTV